MDSSLLKSSKRSKKKALRVRKGLKGAASKPRFCVVKSNRHIEAQLIDDDSGKTIVGLTTNSKEMKDAGLAKKTCDSAKELGKRIAERAKAEGIEFAVFDRGSSKYHGVIAAVADAAREVGLKF